MRHKSELRRLRQSLNISIQELSTRSNVSVGAIHKLEVSTNPNPTISTGGDIAAALGVDLYSVFPKLEK